ncbi:RCC1-like domain-containing protein [Kutzneria chonburiensis]|uniref:Uncharacterized protein n=1 Tax=Kutzneria chonburiensis TaxID=1483604 RepID=A0ABV6MUB8_9PSEU
MTVFRTLTVAGVVAALAMAVLPGVAAAKGPQAASAGATFVPVAAKRVLDPKTVGAEKYLWIDLNKVVPANATAVVLDVTATNATADTTVRATPTPIGNGGGASNLNLGPGETRTNLVTIALGRSQFQGEVYLTNHAGSVDLTADLAGYYVDDNSGSRYTAISPQRVQKAVSGTTSVDLSNVLPSTAKAVTFNLTGANPTAATAVTAWPHGTPQPQGANLSLLPGETRANLVTVAVGADRVVDLNTAANVDLAVDVEGYYATDRGDAYFTLSPLRVNSTTVANDSTVDLSPWLPTTAKAVVHNVTATSTDATAITAYAAGGALPTAANVSLAAGKTAANQTVTPLSDLKLALHTDGRADVATDIAGYFGTAASPCAGQCLYAFGRNDFGQLGDGTATTYRTRGVGQVAGLTAVKQITGDYEAGYVLREDGTVWAIGHTGKTNGYSTQPVPIRGLSDVVSVDAGNGEGLAVKADGTVWHWGDSLIATQVAGLSDVTQVSAGSNLALRRDGTVWWWFGDYAPSQLTMPGRITSVASSGLTRFVVRDDGTVWSWGSNYSGELGIGTDATYVDQPTQVVGLTGVTKVVAARAQATYAIKADGTVWAWGSSWLSGQVTPSNGPYRYSSPRQVPSLSHVTDVVAGYYYALALTADGTVWAWGSLVSAEALKTPDMRPEETPTKVPGLDGLHVASIAAGGYQGYIVANG